MFPTFLTPTARLGVDVGRVLVGASTDGSEPDTSFLSAAEATALAIPPEPGAFDVVRDAAICTGGSVHVVSKCGTRIQLRTRAWLAHQGFHRHTGVPPEHVHFVKKRPEKRLVATALGLTHFVDDRLDVLDSMRGLVPVLVWFGAAGHVPEGLNGARDWAAVRALLL